MIGCCSKYVECSNEGKCISLLEEIKTHCYYKKNLEKGMNFYSNSKKNKKTCIYIVVNNRCFIVRSRHHKTGLSYKLRNEDIEIIEKEFENLGVDYKYSVENDECIIEGTTEEDPTRATSQVVININKKEYNILNFNTWLIKIKAGNEIAEYLSNLGIRASVINKGYNSNIREFQPKSIKKKENKCIKPIYEQLTLF